MATPILASVVVTVPVATITVAAPVLASIVVTTPVGAIS